MSSTRIKLLTGTSLAQKTVLDQEGTLLGEVVEWMVDAEAGYVLYVVLAVDKICEKPDRLYPLPWGIVDIVADSLRLDVTLDQLAHAPSFSRHAWPDLASAEWRRAIHSYYSDPAYWQESTAGIT